MFSFFNSDPDKLLTIATELKNAGKIDEAIEKLKKAYKGIAKTEIIYSVETFLRLPLYLQQAKRSDEAWGEFNKLLSVGYPNKMMKKELLPMDNCIIYDKMRLFLQRENRFKESIVFGIFSFVSWGVGLYYQKRKDELKGYFAPDNTDLQITKLLKKAKSLEKKDKILETVNLSIKSVPKIDFSKLNKDIYSILDN